MAPAYTPGLPNVFASGKLDFFGTAPITASTAQAPWHSPGAFPILGHL